MNILPGQEAGDMDGDAILAFRTSTTASGETITIPSSAGAGDLAILVDSVWSNGFGAPSNVSPDGFSGVGSLSSQLGGQDFRINVNYRILDASDPGRVLTGMAPGSGHADKILLVLAGSISSINVVNDDREQANNADPGDAVATAGAGDLQSFAIGIITATQADPAFDAVSPSFDDTIVQGNLEVGYKLYKFGATPAAQTVGITDVGGGSGRCYAGAGIIEVS